MVIDQTIYISAAVSGVLSLALVPLVRHLAHRFHWVSHPRADRWNRKAVALMGGVGIFGAYLAGGLWSHPNNFTLWSILLTGSCMFGLGLIDDFIHIKPSTKLIGQIMCAALAINAGHSIHFFHNEALNIVVSFLWIIAITNALNLLDNMDGLAAGVGIIASGFLAAVFIIGARLPLAGLALCLCASLIGFLVYNFYPATIFMGDSGSLLIGFTLALLSMGTSASMGSTLTAIVVPALVLAVPILDMTYVSLTRILRGQPVSEGGKDHTSHCLISLGLSEPRAALTLYALAAISGALALWITRAPEIPKLLLIPAILVVFSLIGVYLAHMTYDQHPRKTDPGQRTPWMTKLLLHLTYKRRIFEILLDFALILFCYYFAYDLRFDFHIGQPYLLSFTKSLPLVILTTYGCFFVAGIYRGIWRFTGTHDAIRFFAGSALATGTSIVAVVLIYRFENFSRSVFPIFGILLFVAISLTRFSFKWIGAAIQSLRKQQTSEIPVVIYGAGEGGEMALREIIKQNGHWNWKPVGFIDDDNKKQRLKIHGVPILGTSKEIDKIYKRGAFKQIIVSSRQIPDDALQHLVAFCTERGVELKRFRLVIESVLS
jgi:UDP-GlcNAc:undecaprenyl-phosphate GlcNAc-1-phosphate transferase